MSNRFAEHWLLDPKVEFLNHGAFGACPRPVLAVQSELRARLEADPVRFMLKELEPLLDAVRVRLAGFVGARPRELALITNTTQGVNTLLASSTLRAGDEILITNHTYPACRNAVESWARRSGASVVVAEIPLPVSGEEPIVEAVLRAVTNKTRLALIDHVTSATALIFPVAKLTAELRARGVEVLIDGAHAPGMVRLDIAALGADYYVGNLHKWCCAPKGAALLWVSEERQARVRPLVVSHGMTSQRTDRSRFQLEFDWVGTEDPTAVLAVPAALDFLGGLLPGGWDELRARNHELACAARRLLLSELGGSPICPEELLGSMATVLLPDARHEPDPAAPLAEPLYGKLCERGFQVLAAYWPKAPRQYVRVTCQIYNELEQYRRFAAALREVLPEV
ncbi:MAG TPA: aminotransferase class V-fold PLP-dependent enzyme [Polyangiaceae bacterium]